MFDERLDSLKTPELDEPKETNSEEAERKHSLPLETYKRHLNRLYVLTEGVPKNPDFCKSRSVPVKQARSFIIFNLREEKAFFTARSIQTCEIQFGGCGGLFFF